MGLADLHALIPVLAAAGEKSKTAFYISGGLLALWAVVVSVFGITRPDFPHNITGSRGVMGVSALLVASTVGLAVATSSSPPKSNEAKASPGGGQAQQVEGTHEIDAHDGLELLQWQRRVLPVEDAPDGGHAGAADGDVDGTERLLGHGERGGEAVAGGHVCGEEPGPVTQRRSRLLPRRAGKATTTTPAFLYVRARSTVRSVEPSEPITISRWSRG